MVSKPLLFIAITFAWSAGAWSIPGLIPKNYEKLQKLDIFVGQLYS